VTGDRGKGMQPFLEGKLRNYESQMLGGDVL
jgi:hypothetical protein